ncbi:hypothetical protein CEK25_011960 [Fusarium fujikuroi]|nr:hypothetical protein CEK25_011960 [Fusarium fujikuroi]
MDLAITLIKSVARAFYETRDILVIDALILHEALRDDDLAYLMSTNTKELHKICGKLRYYASREREKRVLLLILQSRMDGVGPEGFLCHRCSHVLTFEADRTSTGHEQSTRLNDQFKFISELLPKIDAVHIPECDFDRAFAKARPVKRDETHQRAQTTAVDSGANRPMAVKGLTNTGPQSIAVNISTSDGPTEAEKAAEQARKEQIAKQNALPSWMSNSTVTGESFSAGAAPGTASVVKKESSKDAGPAAPAVANAQIDDIFEKLKAEIAQEKSEEEEDEEEEEDLFEDVPATKKVKLAGPDTQEQKEDEDSEEIEFEDV